MCTVVRRRRYLECPVERGFERPYVRPRERARKRQLSRDQLDRAFHIEQFP